MTHSEPLQREGQKDEGLPGGSILMLTVCHRVLDSPEACRQIYIWSDTWSGLAITTQTVCKQIYFTNCHEGMREKQRFVSNTGRVIERHLLGVCIIQMCNFIILLLKICREKKSEHKRGLLDIGKMGR